MSSPADPSFQSLRRVFRDGFFVHDLASALVSFDASTAAGLVRETMDRRRFEIVGVRVDGVTAGFVERGDLGDDAAGPALCGDALRPFEPDQIVPDDLPLVDLVLRLNRRPRLFVASWGRPVGIVTRTDLQKPPVRMWLFGMITLIEMRFSRLIEAHCPVEVWRPLVSAGRLEKAELLLAERARRQQDLSLLDCLQLADKAQIVARHPPLRSLTRFTSRRQLEQAAKMLEKLRNNLAHAQDIISTDWETIVGLSTQLDAVLTASAGPPPHAAAPEPAPEPVGDSADPADP